MRRSLLSDCWGPEAPCHEPGCRLCGDPEPHDPDLEFFRGLAWGLALTAGIACAVILLARGCA